MALKPPKYAQSVVQRLENAGYRAYFVGGAVRDALLGRRASDWDVCTSALPEEILSLFPHCIPTGIRHGTVTVVTDKRTVEVTTFRTEGIYADHRRPEKVEFVSALETDLARRDFTVNAMALDLRGTLTDPFGGQDDLKNRCIRCVGVPDKRFSEDALRMLRALRFSAQLGFAVEAETFAAIERCAPLAAALSAERVRDETEKLLLSPAPETVSLVLRCGLLDAFVQSGVSPDALRLKRLPRTPEARWAGLSALLLHEEWIDSPENFLRALRLPSATVRSCGLGARAACDTPKRSRLEWKRLLASEGEQAAYCAAAASDALCAGGALRTLREIEGSGECVSMRQLALNGDTLLARGIRGTEAGKTLRMLLDHVLRFPEDNEQRKLLALLDASEQ